MNKHIVIFSLFFSILFADLKGISQTKEIDSLKAVELVTSDTATKTKILLTIANKYRLINYDSVLFYTNKAYDYALLTQNNIMVIKCLIDLAYINVSIGNNDKSIPLYNQAKQLCIKEDNQYLLAYIYIDLGRYYSALSNYAEVINSLDTALDIINNNNITQLKSVVYNNISHLYLAIHDIDIASYYSNLAITYSKGDTNKTNYINNLFLHGKIFLYKNMLDSTFLCYNNALTIAKESNNKELIQQAYRKISDYYIEKKEYNNSNQYIDSSIIYCRKLSLINELASLLTYKAHISSIKKDYTKALQYNLQALKLRKKTGHRSSICSSLLNIGGNYTPLGEYDKAHSYLERGIEIANEINSIIYLNYGYDKLSKLYKSEGNFEEALQYTDLKTQYKDSIITNQSNEKILFFRIQYELEKEKTLSEKIKYRKKSNEAIFLIIIIILTVSALILLSWLNYLRKKSTKEILKLSRIIETTAQAVAITNTKGHVLYVNNGLLKILGYVDENEIIGKSMFEFTIPTEKDFLVNEILPVLLNSGHWNGEITIKRKDGTGFIAEEACSVINNKNGKPEYYVAIFTDITDRRKAETELKNTKESLEKTVKTQDKLFSIIAHDLTSPFSSIIGLSEVLAVDFDKYERNQLIHFSQLIYNSSKNTLDLLTNLLNWSRSQLGSIKLIKKELSIYDLVVESSQTVMLNLSNKNISFYNEVDRDVNIYADNSTISVVIRNILSNAIKFTHRGGDIRVSSAIEDNNVQILFSDTGVGIKEENIPDIFELNDDKSSKGTEEENGTGLGLILCQEFTELNDGKISVESTYGEGSTFILSLPLTKSTK